MKTENLSTLKIHKLTQEQYERELANNNIDYTAMYLTPDEGRSQELTTEITESVTDEQVPSAKAVYTYVQSASTDHEHSQYALADDVDSAISNVNENVENHLIDTSNPHSVTANQIGAVPDTRTVNGKVLSTDITLSYSDVDADQSGTAQTKANEALEGAKAYTDSFIISKANVDDLNNHTDDTDIHVTIDEKIAWNNKSDFSGDYNDLNNKPEIPSIEGLATETYVNEKVSQVDIPSTLSELAEDETHRIVTDLEKATWNTKSDFSGSYNDLTDKPSIPSIEGLATEDYVNEHKDNKENPHNVTTEQINAVPNTRTVNGKALNNDITLTPEDIGADVGGTAESKATNALNIAKEYTDIEVDKVENTLNTHTSATNPHNINAELLGVYTKSEVDTKTTELSDKIQENTNAITTLNGVGDGSVDKKITDAFNEFAENLSDDNTVNTYKELIDYASSHNSEFTNLVGEVTSNKNNISDLTTTFDNHTTNTNNPHNVTIDQIGAVPNSRTINSKPLTSNITLTASDVGADASGSANTAESNAKSYTNTQISNLSTSVDTKLSGKADSSHGTHVTYSTTAPVMDGTASVGSATSVARSDHKHPTDTSRASHTDLTSHTGDTTKHITSTERTNWNAAKTHADSTHAPTNAEKNQNAFSNIKAGSTTISADTTTDTIEFVAGSNITLTPDATNDKLTISATNTTYNAASQSASGLMSAADKTKLDGIATGANAYTHPTTAGNKHIPSGGSSGQILRWGADGTAVWGSDNNTTYDAATQSANGLMSATDKKKLDGIASGANAYTHPTTSGNKHIPSGGSSGQILRWSADGTAVWGADNNTDTKVTAVGNHYTPTADSAAALSVDASSTTSATWGSTDLVTGVNIQRDAKGHVTGVTVDSIQMPANPNVDTKVTNTLATTTKAYVTGTTSASTNTGTQVFDTGIYLDSTAGRLAATSFKIGEGCNLVYDGTNKCVSFQFL